MNKITDTGQIRVWANNDTPTAILWWVDSEGSSQSENVTKKKHEGGQLFTIGIGQSRPSITGGGWEKA